MRGIKIIVFCGMCFIGFSTLAIDFSRLNISWQYDPLAEIELADRVTQSGETMSVYIRFRYQPEVQWDMEYLIQPNYESESHTAFETFELDTLLTTSTSFVIKLTFEKPNEDLLVVKVFKEDAFYYYDVRLKNGSLPYSSILLQDENGLPVFDNYLSTSEFDLTGADSFYAMEYQENFGPADPPMGEMKPLAPSILPDSSYLLSDDSKLQDNYFYVIREDSNALSGVTVLKVSPYYPEFKLLGELVASMHYILNEPERRGIRNSKNLKASFDSFWVNTYTTKFRARNAIRNYYNWIEQTNKRFTDFKQGWKTDRGIIYIVYGVPDEVYRSNNQEEWFYDEGPAFEYTVISTFFSPRTYALRRKLDHEESWFEFVSALRRGIND